MSVLLKLKQSKFDSFLCICFLEYLGHGIVHRVVLFVFLKVRFWVGNDYPEIRIHRKERDTCLTIKVALVG